MAVFPPPSGAALIQPRENGPPFGTAFEPGGRINVEKAAKPEEIPDKLRQADVLVGQGHSVSAAIRAINVSEVTYDELPDG